MKLKGLEDNYMIQTWASNPNSLTIFFLKVQVEKFANLIL